MTAKEWLRGFATLVGVDPPTEEEMNDLLKVAGEAAHTSERIAAPLTCWLIARAGITPRQALDVIEQQKASGFTCRND
jgi:hypothetical protein